MVTLMNDMVDLFFLTDRNFLKKVRLEVLKLFELMNCELKESKLVDFLQLWLSPGKLLWQSSSHCWMMPNKFLLVPTKSHEPEQVHCPTSCYSISKFSHNSFSCVGHGSFMICMIAIQSIRPGLCTLILWKWCFPRDKIIDDSKLTAVFPNRVSSHHPKYVHQLATTCFWCFGKALEGGISEHFVEMEVLWQNLTENEVLLRDELTNWWWNSALSYSPYVFVVFGKGVLGIGYFGRSKLDFCTSRSQVSGCDNFSEWFWKKSTSNPHLETMQSC